VNLKYWLSTAMRTMGGSFVRSLGDCIAKSDDDNYQRILATWPEYIEKYMPIAEQLKQEDDTKP